MRDQTDESAVDRVAKIKLVTIIILAGFVFSVFFHFAKGTYFGQSYPHDTFLFWPGDAFNDFMNPYRGNISLNPYFQELPNTQYPFINMLAYFFSFLPPAASLIFFTLGVTILFMYFNYLNLRSGNVYDDVVTVLVCSLLSYPFLFTLDRGNFEGILAIFLLSFMYFFAKGRFGMASLFLALSIAMKAFPIFLIVLFFSKKRYKEALLAVAGSLVITAACLAAFQGGFQANLRFLTSGSNFSYAGLVSFLGQNNLVQRGVTLFTFCKILFVETGTIQAVDMAVFLKFYKTAMAVLSVLLAGYVLLVERVLWKKAALLVFAMLLFPHISADYKLLHLFLPLFLFVNAKEKDPDDTAYAILFGLLLIPKDYYILKDMVSDSGTRDISIAVLLNPLIMLYLMAGIIVPGLKNVPIEEVRERLKDQIEGLRGLLTRS